MRLKLFGKHKPADAEKKERLLTPDYILVIVSILGTSVLNNFFVATITPYMNLLTGRAVYGGVMITAYALTSTAVRPVSGVISDKYGRVKMIVAGALICAAATAGFGFTTSLALLIVIRAVSGIGYGINSTCAGAAVADIVPKSRLSEGVGYFGLYATVAQMVAPAIALHMVANGEISDYRSMFLTATAISAVSGAFGCFITYERKAKTEGEKETLKSITKKPPVPEDRNRKTLLGFEYAVFAPCLVLLLFSVGFTSILSFTTAFAIRNDFGNIGLFFTFSALGMLVSRLFLGKAVDRHGPDPVIIPALAVFVVCLALIPFQKTAAALIVLAFPIGMSRGAVTTTVNSTLFIRCSPSRRGTASGAYFAAIDLGYAAGAPLLGSVIDAMGYTVMFFVSASLVTVALVTYLLCASDKKYKAKTL
ncbi:MAG: MFS transporter [Oscillospiraceae bacterium]|nr:MFS transporter [Oscillospiraceae bacterium]